LKATVFNPFFVSTFATFTFQFIALTRFVIIFYFIVFGTFILFSRQPDYFDGESTYATIHFMQDSVSQTTKPFAVFQLNHQTYKTNAAYIFRQFTENEKVDVIYESSQPENAAVYMWWGYWIKWQEILISIVLLVVGLQAAKAIIKNPSPETLIDELEDAPQPRKRKYS
jgi:hypothetical protein